MSKLNSPTEQTKPPIKVGESEIVSKNDSSSRLGARDKTVPAATCQQPEVIACQGEGENTSRSGFRKSGSVNRGGFADKPSADASSTISERDEAIKRTIKLYPHKHGDELAMEIIDYLDRLHNQDASTRKDEGGVSIEAPVFGSSQNPDREQDKCVNNSQHNTPITEDLKTELLGADKEDKTAQ